MKKKFSTTAIVILMLLGLRIFGQVEAIMTSLNIGAVVMFCVYLAAIIGVFGRKPWGDILSGVTGIMDIATTLMYTEGASRVGAVVVDLLLVYLAFDDYRSIKAGKKAEDAAAPEAQA
ncbi:MAG TPA: hypothetical protein VLZ07_12550 [Syntrophales bacterium]|nr:hypothetical protein [Syntrophales bacterium]